MSCLWLAKRPAGVSPSDPSTSSGSGRRLPFLLTWVVFGGRARHVLAGVQFGSSIIGRSSSTTDNKNESSSSSSDKTGDGGAIGSGDSGSGVVVDEPQSSMSSFPPWREWTATSLEQHYQPAESNLELYHADLEKQCAAAALVVDLLCLVTERSEDEEDEHDTTNTTTSRTTASVPDFGVTLVQGLSDKSGAPGPLLFDISNAAARH